MTLGIAPTQPLVPDAAPAAAEAVAAPAAPATAVPVTAPVPVAASTETPAAPVRPEGLADEFWDPAAGVKVTDLATKFAELQAAETARKQGVPADAKGYKLELAEPVLDMAGKPVTFNADEPLAQNTLAWAHKHGLPQGAVSELLGIYTNDSIAALKANNDAVAAETAKLGAKAEERFSATRSGLAAAVGDDAAKALMSNIGTAAAFEAVEKIVTALRGPALGSPAAPATPADQFAGQFGADRLAAIRASQAGRS